MMISTLDLLATSYQAYVSAFCPHAVSDSGSTGRMKAVEFDKMKVCPSKGFMPLLLDVSGFRRH